MNSQVARIHQQGDASVVEVHGEVDMHRSPELHQLLREVCQEQPAKLVVDLSRVEYMDSSGIGTLVEIFRRVKGFEGQMMLVVLAGVLVGIGGMVVAGLVGTALGMVPLVGQAAGVVVLNVVGAFVPVWLGLYVWAAYRDNYGLRDD